MDTPTYKTLTKTNTADIPVSMPTFLSVLAYYPRLSRVRGMQIAPVPPFQFETECRKIHGTDQVLVDSRRSIQVYSRPTYTWFRDLDLSKMRQKRGGILPFIRNGSEISLLMGLDATYMELTDFGGRFSYKRSDSDIVDTALRECAEETLEILFLYKSDLIDSLCVYDDESFIIMFDMSPILPRMGFEGIEPLWVKDIIVSAFSRRVQDDSEVISIEWISLEELSRRVTTHHKSVYKKVRCLLRDISKFGNLIP